MSEKNNQSFEQAFARLEEILDLINEGQISLDDSLKLFEEADGLIQSCTKRLTSAEKRIETLIKNRQNELLLDKNAQPITKSLELENEHVFEKRSH